MKVVGLLSSKKEAKEIKSIVKVCSVEDRIHLLVRMRKLKDLMEKEHKS
ncbi:MAG: hypothetical protein V5A64_07060 [Candidatus Thermoplasmatota archaeon]